MKPDFGKTASDYSRHRQGFPEELFDMFSTLGIELEKARVVDLGTGTGTLARSMARRGATVTGVDPSTKLTEEAQRLDLEWGVATKYVTSTAEKTGLESDGYDLVTFGQSWWWFDSQAALAEARRILRPGGALVICSFDWLPVPGSIVEQMERLIKEHNPDWNMDGGNGQHPEFISDLINGGFEQVRSDHRTVDAVYTKAAWRGRVRASAGIGASLEPQQIAKFDSEHSALLDRFTSSDPIPVPHAIFVATGRNPVR